MDDLGPFSGCQHGM